MNLKQLLGLCEHQWEWISQINVVDTFGDRVGTKVHLWCKMCGEAKSKIL